MPNWKKLIVSGSDATLNSLTVTTSGSFYDDLTISGSNSSLIIKGDGNKFARITHDGSGLIIDGGVQNQYISIGSPTWNYPNGVKVYGDLEQTGSAGGTATFEGPTQSTLNLKTTTNSKNNYIVGTTAGNLSLRPNGSESLMLLANGNVGIGTSSPDRSLHVRDAAIVTTKLEGTNQGSLLDLVNSNASQTYNGLRFTQGTTSKMAITHIADGTTKGYIQIGNNWATGSEILVVDGRTSNVGIGDYSLPGAKLQIGDARSSAILLKVGRTSGSTYNYRRLRFRYITCGIAVIMRCAAYITLALDAVSHTSVRRLAL